MPKRFEASGDFVSRLEGPQRREAIPPEVVVSRMRLSEDDVVVDLGAGTGYFAFPIAGRVREVLALDIERKMLDTLRGKALATGIENLDLLRSDMSALPIADSSADHVLAAFVYHEAEDPATLLSECARVLRPSGLLTVVDFQKRETPMGPPVSERKTPGEVRSAAKGAFREESAHSEQVYYQLIFSKKRGR